MSAEDQDIGIVTDRIEETACLKCGCRIFVGDLDPFTKIKCPECDLTQNVPAQLGPFKLLNLLGAGGMGGVYHALDETLGRYVAVKVMMRKLGEDREFVGNFKREAQAAAKLNHPNIAQIYSFGEEKGQPYIVMELVSGMHFEELVAEGKPIDQSLVMQIGLAIAEGMSAAADIALVHGDIKPENILLDEQGRAKLVDFGIASFAGQAPTQAKGSVWGTPYYVAPENVRGEQADTRSDIFSLGATLFHALAGQPPFEGDTPLDVVKARLESEAPPLRQLCPEITERVEGIIQRMLQPEPARRYPTYASLISDIRKALAELPPPQFRPRSKRVTGPTSTGRAGGPSKIVIKRSPKMTASALAEYKQAAKGKGRSRRPEKKPREPGEGAGKGGRRAIKAILWILLLACLAGGGVKLWLHFKQRREAEYAVRREDYLLQQAGKEATETLGEIGPAVTNILKRAAATEGLIEKAVDAVQVVVGEPFVMPDRVSPAEREAEEDTADEIPATNAAPAAAGETNTLAVVPEPDQSAEEPEIVVRTRQVVTGVWAIASNAETAVKTLKEARVRESMARRARESETAQGNVAQLIAQRDAMVAMGQETTALLKRAKAAAERVESIRTRVLRRRRDEEEARRAEEQRQAEEAEKQRLESAHKVRVEEERAMAEAAGKEIRPLLKQNKFAEAAGTLKRQLGDYRTGEGKEALQVLLDRSTRLAEMKAFLVERLNADPFRWGWGSGSSAKDILGADATFIKVRGLDAPWTRVSPAQMMKFIRHYVDSTKIGARRAGAMSLAAAVYCHENGGVEAAAAFGDKAAELAPSLRAEVERLVPITEQ